MLSFKVVLHVSPSSCHSSTFETPPLCRAEVCDSWLLAIAGLLPPTGPPCPQYSFQPDTSTRGDVMDHLISDLMTQPQRVRTLYAPVYFGIKGKECVEQPMGNTPWA